VGGDGEGLRLSAARLDKFNVFPASVFMRGHVMSFFNSLWPTLISTLLPLLLQLILGLFTSGSAA
jgi:hypothetical protein